ncbi:hypothetical protein J7620_09200 [Wohlfahrtiimonas chitiniclastica]|uniref:hypothetical protein n=1 Tax=Wohlfahrtiimonas chitiniclastica TaxID=400946 RepID=UPI001BCC56FE|nr:hypothetical protein [Wohlfahrtiimonas chitiniclastica]MBS7835124.1 hypothetical protein [Wohlfahrtiimonas chitiniclastica]
MHMHLSNEDLDGLITEITTSQEWIKMATHTIGQQYDKAALNDITKSVKMIIGHFLKSVGTTFVCVENSFITSLPVFADANSNTGGSTQWNNSVNIKMSIDMYDNGVMDIGVNAEIENKNEISDRFKHYCGYVLGRLFSGQLYKRGWVNNEHFGTSSH